MIHKIEPHKYYPEFRRQLPGEDDYLFVFDDNRVLLLKDKADTLFIPTFRQLHAAIGSKQTLERFMVDREYLFSIDETGFFRANSEDLYGLPVISGAESAGTGTVVSSMKSKFLPVSICFCTPNVFRSFQPEYLAFAGITACQINRFRLERKFCGRCGHETEPSTSERAMVCPECGQIEYPKISPAIITAVTDGDRLLLTKYAGGGYKNWALVAGFVEVGETFKGAVRREVMEEVGLRVGEITYYKSQPWSFSDSAMIGFIAKLEGDDTITLQESELATAKWFTRDEIPDMPDHISIGQEMIRMFKEGKL